MLPEVRALVDHYKLEPMPVEETLFINTYRSDQELAPGKPFATAMIGLYCDEPRSVSLFHRLLADEIWHFYGGDPLRLVLLHDDGSSQTIIMGSEPLAGHLVQAVVPAGVWQGGHLLAGGRYALFGCTMAPGFTYDMIEFANRDQLSEIYPDRADDIDLLCYR